MGLLLALYIGAPAQARTVYVGSEPTLRCAPMHGGTVTLPRGERITSKQLFDAVRWEAQDSVYGPSGEYSVLFPHPLSDQAGLQTELDVTTDGDPGLYRIHLLLVKDHPSCDVTFERRPRPEALLAPLPSPSPRFLEESAIAMPPAPTPTPLPSRSPRRVKRGAIAAATPRPIATPSPIPSVAPSTSEALLLDDPTPSPVAVASPSPVPRVVKAKVDRRRPSAVATAIAAIPSPAPSPTLQARSVQRIALAEPRPRATPRPAPALMPTAGPTAAQPSMAAAGGTLESKCVQRKLTPYGKPQGNAPFRPVDAYSDGQNACIVLPAGVAMPVIYALVGHNQRDFVNWSFDGSRHMFIVYSVPPALELFDGDKNVILPPSR